MTNKVYAKVRSSTDVSVYTEPYNFICAFQGPMALSAAATFIGAFNKKKEALPADINKYVRKENG